MAKKTEVKNVPILPLNTPILLRAFHKTTGEMFEKKISYKEWIDFKKHPDYDYRTFQLI